MSACGTEPMDPRRVEVLQDAGSWARLRTSGRPVALFKFSPRCPVSFAAEDAYKAWLAELPEVPPFTVARVDVVVQRELSRAIGAELDVKHESPQAILLGADGKVVWHDSHDRLTRETLKEKIG